MKPCRLYPCLFFLVYLGTVSVTSLAADVTPLMASNVAAAAPPPTTKKVIYGLRHAHSQANAWMSQPGNDWGDATFRDDPSLVDASLSDQGRRQVAALADRLAGASSSTTSSSSAWVDEVELVVVSPLTRCLQTWEGGCRSAFLERRSDGEADSMAPPVVLALPLAAERVFTASDTGRSIAAMRKEFPHIDWAACDGPSHPAATDPTTTSSPWWYSPSQTTVDGTDEWRPHGQGQSYAVPGEPEDVFTARMDQLQTWLQERPEKCILLVCHWGVLRHFTGDDHIDNCSLVRMEL
jgi:broad specificity phosphatase PhoE